MEGMAPSIILKLTMISEFMETTAEMDLITGEIIIHMEKAVEEKKI
jgi:hypothetical protein